MKSFYEASLKEKDERLRDNPWTVWLSLIQGIFLLTFFYVFHLETMDFASEYFQLMYLGFSKDASNGVIVISIFSFFILLNLVLAFLKGGWVRKVNSILMPVFIFGIYYYFAHLPPAVVIENGQEKVLCKELKAVNVNEELCKQCQNRSFKEGKCLLLNTMIEEELADLITKPDPQLAAKTDGHTHLENGALVKEK